MLRHRDHFLGEAEGVGERIARMVAELEAFPLENTTNSAERKTNRVSQETTILKQNSFKMRLSFTLPGYSDTDGSGSFYSMP